jgi:hypothetical protein
MGTKKTRTPAEFYMGFPILVCSAVGIIFFFLSYRTGYFTFGDKNSGLVELLLMSATGIEILYMILLKKIGDNFWVRMLSFVVPALLTAAAILLLGDRVEAIGNCIVTDYDSGHGGEEAVYYSIVASVSMMIGVILGVIGSFFQGKYEKEFIVEL